MSTMVKSIAVVVAVGILISGAAYAAEKAAGQAAEKQAIVDVGNKTCPVTGDPVDGKDFYVYKGKRYGLCCPMCTATFASDPEKYSAIAEKEAAGK